MKGREKLDKLQHYFETNNGRLIHKWMHYFAIYERHFERFVGQEVNILEIGVSHGGSLQMWKQYFGDKATIVGIDIDPRCISFEEEQVSILIGDQGDRNFWRTQKAPCQHLILLSTMAGTICTSRKFPMRKCFLFYQNKEFI